MHKFCGLFIKLIEIFVSPVKNFCTTVVSLYDGGWSFAQFLLSHGHIHNEVVSRNSRPQYIDILYTRSEFYLNLYVSFKDVPLSYLERVGHIIPEKVEFLVSSGVRFVGGFNKKKGK